MLLSVRPHSCDCERMNSVHKAVQTKARNRLSIARVEKLIRTKCFLLNEEAREEDFSIIQFVDFDPQESRTEVAVALEQFEMFAEELDEIV